FRRVLFRPQPLEEDPDLTFRLRPDELRDGTSLAERDDVRDRADIEHGGDVAVLVRVDLDELDPAGVIGRDLLDDRTERTARAAPRRPEVDDDGQPFRSLENLLLERRGRDVHRRSFAAIGSRGEHAAALRPARLHVREYSAAGAAALLRRSVVFGVLARVAAYPVGRILGLVQLDLLGGSFEQIDAEPVGEAQQVDEDVRELVPNLAAFLLVERRAFVLGQPLKELEQFAGLRGERHGEILRRVEALPVALGRETAQTRREPVEIVVAGHV